MGLLLLQCGYEKRHDHLIGGETAMHAEEERRILIRMHETACAGRDGEQVAESRLGLGMCRGVAEKAE